ncbi:phosphate uptake regulator, PhoU [Thermodesulfobium acidiphilum]|uniref:Phosphate-specific transport system accessory protein PhoU n=1 Tax=Thermodesulfobium acidiphilum TaxID=1794699 RepID=A0A2R4W1W8_THEAF|nr:phosphate signaling complex protein PhoU [Thermodesulfobium acidiphilum]AWB10801.1 phosphate uptake regulator, PhoU [Thermodesulfobium acidiphilum]
MERHFDIEIRELTKKLFEMTTLVERAIDLVILSILERDSRIAQEVIESEKITDELEIDIEEQCMTMLALYQPVAKDLRYIVMIMRIIVDLERMSDETKSIAVSAINLLKDPPIELFMQKIPDMAKKVKVMVRNAITSLVEKNEEMALSVIEDDDAVDEDYHNILQNLKKELTERRFNCERIIDWLFITRHFERLGDHATNIAEDVLYIVRGKNVKHMKP